MSDPPQAEWFDGDDTAVVEQPLEPLTQRELMLVLKAKLDLIKSFAATLDSVAVDPAFQCLDVATAFTVAALHAVPPATDRARRTGGKKPLGIPDRCCYHRATSVSSRFWRTSAQGDESTSRFLLVL